MYGEFAPDVIGFRIGHLVENSLWRFRLNATAAKAVETDVTYIPVDQYPPTPP
jgi:hypothetical protein